jgi:hypothetical protein
MPARGWKPLLHSLIVTCWLGSRCARISPLLSGLLVGVVCVCVSVCVCVCVCACVFVNMCNLVSERDRGTQRGRREREQASVYDCVWVWAWALTASANVCIVGAVLCLSSGWVCMCSCLFTCRNQNQLSIQVLAMLPPVPHLEGGGVSEVPPK